MSDDTITGEVLAHGGAVRWSYRYRPNGVLLFRRHGVAGETTIREGGVSIACVVRSRGAWVIEGLARRRYVGESLEAALRSLVEEVYPVSADLSALESARVSLAGEG
jgi:hypothetical protein